jgi:hypothetical protein
MVKVNDHHIAFRTKGTLPGTYDINWHPPKGCNTGCWRFDHATGKHIISVHRDAFKAIADKGVTSGVTDLYRLIYEHEAAHSLYTTPDLKKLADDLRAEKIPWRLQNLFEDVRIERIWLRKVRMMRHWRWQRWIKMPAPADISNLSPTQLLYHLKCAPIGKGRRLPKCAQPLEQNIYYNKVIKFYNAIRKAPNTFDLIPILKEWLKEFPNTGDDTIEQEGGLGTGDLADAIKEAGGTVDSIQVGDPTLDPGHGVSDAPAPADGAPMDTMISDEGRRGDQLARVLGSAFRGGTEGDAPTARPSKKLNVKGLLRGNWSRPFIGRAKADERKPHVSIIFDLSASMGGQLAYIDRANTMVCSADDAGRVLVRCLSVLARRGLITGTVYASGQGGVQKEWDMPLPISAYNLLDGNQGDDGIPTALSPRDVLPEHRQSGSRFAEITSKSKLAIVYTDGEFGSFVNKAPLHARGLYTLGLCCTARDKTHELKRQFDHVISCESLEALADALVRFLRSARF